MRNAIGISLFVFGMITLTILSHLYFGHDSVETGFVGPMQPMREQLGECALVADLPAAHLRREDPSLTDKQRENQRYAGFVFERAQEVSALRGADYGVGKGYPILVDKHHGKQVVDPQQMWTTICGVLQRMSNVKSTDAFRALMFESMVTETVLGGINYGHAAKSYRNYGIAQFRLDTAKETLAWLKKVRKDVHEQVMQFYDAELSLKDNLMCNVPFSIALMAQYYMRRIPDIHANIGTLHQRAVCWSREYNTSKGLGTIEAYKKRVLRFQKKHDFTLPS